MATSPIFGWEEPDDTDLVKDGAAAIRTLGNAIDTTMGTMVPKTIIDAKGDLIAGTAADTAARLAVGTNGYVLSANSSTATGLEWIVAGGGKLKQVVTATGTTDTTISTTSYADAGLEATITPTSASSTILVLTSLCYDIYRASNSCAFGLQLVRAATNIWTTGIDQFNFAVSSSTGNQIMGVANLSYLDSPATTSATTYKMQGAISTTSNSQRLLTNWGSNVSTITLLEIGA